MPLQPTSESPERRYHDAVLANLAEGLHLTRVSDGVIVYTNPTLDAMFGYAPGELVGRSVATLNAPTPDRSPSEVAAEIIASLAEGGVWAGELQNITKQGTIIWCRAKVSSFDHPEFGQVWISVHEDVTERKQAEAALRESEHKLRMIADHLPAFIAYVDHELRYQFVNRNHPALVGKSLKQVIGAPVRDVMGEEFFARARPNLERALAGERVSYEITTPYSSGPIVVASEYVPDTDEAGVVRGIYFLGSDITRRKQAEAALRASEERHRTIIQTAMDGFWLVDAEGRLLQVNEAYCRMSGYSAAELTTMRVADIEIEGPAGVLGVAPSRASSSEARVECRHRRKDGSTFEVELSIQYWPTEGGRFITFLRDLTERRQAEAERTRLESQLQQASKMEAVGQLAGGIAHDFNNILMTMTLQLECLRESIEAGDDDALPTLQEALASVHRAADFTKQILLFSRQQAVHPVRYQPSRVLGKLAGLLARALGERVKLDVVSATEPLWVEGDIGMFEQVVTNLALNARDAMPCGGELTVEIFPTSLDDRVVSGHRSVQPGPFVCVRVSDTGNGIAPEVLPHVFEPFFTTKPVGKGSGLGLAIVHGIVSRHHGFVDVERRVSGGTTFTVFLPRATAPSIPPAQQTPRPTRGLGGSERVLVVEDEPVLRRLIVSSLSQLGYRVTEAGNAVEGLALAEHEGFDLLLADMVMPEGMSGLQLANQLMVRDPSLKAIILSGHSPTELEAESAHASGITRLAKPCGVDVLLRTVRSCLDSAR